MTFRAVNSRLAITLGLRYDYATRSAKSRNNHFNPGFSRHCPSTPSARCRIGVDSESAARRWSSSELSYLPPPARTLHRLPPQTVLRCWWNHCVQWRRGAHYNLVRNGVRDRNQRFAGDAAIDDGFNDSAAQSLGLPSYFYIDPRKVPRPTCSNGILSIQRELPHGMLLETLYAGRYGHLLLPLSNWNNSPVTWRRRESRSKT